MTPVWFYFFSLTVGIWKLIFNFFFKLDIYIIEIFLLYFTIKPKGQKKERSMD